MDNLTHTLRKYSKNPIKVGARLFLQVWYPYLLQKEGTMSSKKKRRNKAQERQEKPRQAAKHAVPRDSRCTVLPLANRVPVANASP